MGIGKYESMSILLVHIRRKLWSHQSKKGEIFFNFTPFFGPLEGACQMVPEYFFEIKIKGKNLKVHISSLVCIGFQSDFENALNSRQNRSALKTYQYKGDYNYFKTKALLK